MSNLAWSKSSRRTFGVLAAPMLAILIGQCAFAQDIPSVPSAPPVPTAAPAAPAGFMGKCTSCISSLGGCFKGCCNTPLGKLINGAFQPIEMATGGVIPAPCPGPNDPSKKGGGGGADGSAGGGPPGPQQAAEAIKKDQAQAKARVEAVKYLATVPCHYYPEAEAGLILALRTDRSECVRWEAAHALAQGCCCTKKTIEALKIVASGSQKDGNPSEKSFRVRVEALNALEHCLTMCGDAAEPQRPELPAPMPQPETIPTPLPEPKRPEMPLSEDDANEPTADIRQVNYYEEVEKQSSATVLAEARHLVASSRMPVSQVRAPRRGSSLIELWQRSDRSDDTTEANTEEASSAVRVELPGEASVGTSGTPTLAPPRPPAVDMTSDHGTAAVQAPAGRPYAKQVSLPVPYPTADTPIGRSSPSVQGPVHPPHTATPAYSPLPSSLPQLPSMGPMRPEMLPMQALPPLDALPQSIASPVMTATTMPTHVAPQIGPQGYLYPSTETRSNVLNQTPHVAQQPEWANPNPRR